MRARCSDAPHPCTGMNRVSRRIGCEGRCRPPVASDIRDRRMLAAGPCPLRFRRSSSRIRRPGSRAAGSRSPSGSGRPSESSRESFPAHDEAAGLGGGPPPASRIASRPGHPHPLPPFAPQILQPAEAARGRIPAGGCRPCAAATSPPARIYDRRSVLPLIAICRSPSFSGTMKRRRSRPLRPARRCLPRRADAWRLRAFPDAANPVRSAPFRVDYATIRARDRPASAFARSSMSLTRRAWQS